MNWTTDRALLDIEYQRIELLKFNLFDNSGTYKDYVLGREGKLRPTSAATGTECQVIQPTPIANTRRPRSLMSWRRCGFNL